MLDPGPVLFAIEAGVRLGNKINDVLIDETVERPLALPIGNLFVDIKKVAAVRYFDQHPELTRRAAGDQPAGPFRGISEDKKVEVYRTILAVGEWTGDGGDGNEAVDIVVGLAHYKQYRKGFGARPALQRTLGAVVEIAIDYVAANPRALGKDTSGRKVLHAFILRLDDVNFSEGTSREIISSVLLASLETLSDQTTLVSDNARVQALVSGVTKALVEDVESISSSTGKIIREDLVKRIASSVLRGGVMAFTENTDLFLPKDSATGTIVHSTLVQVLEGIKGKEDLFTNESVQLLFHAALTAVGENTAVLSDDKVLQGLIKSTVTALTNAEGKKLFPEETVAAILAGSLVTLRDNMETLLSTTSAEGELLSGTLKALANSLASSLAGGGTVKDLLSRRQLVELASVALEEVARHPEKLLGGDLDSDRKVALAQIIGSVARALGDNPKRFVTGESFVELVRQTLRVASLNADKLLDFRSANTRSNTLFVVIKEIVDAVALGKDSRSLVDRDVFLDIVLRVLPVVSANLEGLDRDIVKEAVEKALELASGALEGRINGDNLPKLIEGFLERALWDRLDLGEASAVTRLAGDLLFAAFSPPSGEATRPPGRLVG